MVIQLLVFSSFMNNSELFIPKILIGYDGSIPLASKTVYEVAIGVDSLYIFLHYFRSGWVLSMSDITIDYL